MRDRVPDIVRDTAVDPFGRTITMEAVNFGSDELEMTFEQLAVMAEPHIDMSEGHLTSIEAPKHMAFHTMGEPIPTENIEPIASNADRRNPAIQAAVDSALGRTPYVIPSIYDTLRDGYNVGVCFSHNVIQDVPLGLGALLTRLGEYERYRQDRGDASIDVVRGILVGQILKRVGIVIRDKDSRVVVPADYVMTMMAHDVWSSITTGRSAHRLRKDMPDITQDNNLAMKNSIGAAQDRGGLFLAGSISGSIMKPSEEDPNVYVMDGPTDGSMEMAMHEKMRWLCMALLIEPGGVVRAEFSGESEGRRPGELRSFDSPDEINAALTGLTETATAITSVEGRRYVLLPKKSRRMLPRRRGS